MLSQVLLMIGIRLQILVLKSVFFDIKKAFDTVPHRTLITKLKSLSLSPTIIKWI